MPTPRNARAERKAADESNAIAFFGSRTEVGHIREHKEDKGIAYNANDNERGSVISRYQSSSKNHEDAGAEVMLLRMVLYSPILAA